MARPAHKKGRGGKPEEKEFQEEVIAIDRVTKVVKGGRRLRFRAIVVIGNRKGKVGMGTGKSNEVTGAIQKAIAKAKKGLLTVTLDGGTIPHKARIKYKSSQLLLMPAVEGTGVIAGGSVRKVLELAGIKDILSKSFGSTTKVNITKATFVALKSLNKTPFMERRMQKSFEEKKAMEAKKTQETQEQKPAQKPQTN
jgi:small subunit ribosomal protein S5